VKERILSANAQELYGVRPDITILGKIIGGGLPIGAFGGARRILEKLSPAGPVYQAGTLSGNPLATAAGLAQLALLADGQVHRRLESRAARLETGLRAAAAAAGVESCLNRVGSMLTLLHPRRYRPRFSAAVHRSLREFFHRLLERESTSRPPSTVSDAHRCRHRPRRRRGRRALGGRVVRAGSNGTRSCPGVARPHPLLVASCGAVTGFFEGKAPRPATVAGGGRDPLPAAQASPPPVTRKRLGPGSSAKVTEPGEAEKASPPTAAASRLVIAGHVTDTAGQPIAEATIDWSQIDHLPAFETQALTDEEGAYRLEVTAAGPTYQLSASGRALRQAGRGTWCPARRGAGRRTPSWRRGAGSGVVIDQESVPVAGAEVRARAVEVASPVVSMALGPVTRRGRLPPHRPRRPVRPRGLAGCDGELHVSARARGYSGTMRSDRRSDHHPETGSFAVGQKSSRERRWRSSRSG
jgi:hypothetical protein